jgi:hypothetical protein
VDRDRCRESRRQSVIITELGKFMTNQSKGRFGGCIGIREAPLTASDFTRDVDE